MHDTQAKTPEPVGRFLLRELAVPVSVQAPDLAAAIAGFLRVKRSRIGEVTILRKSLDSRRRNQPLWRFAVEFEFRGPLRHPKVFPASGNRDGTGVAATRPVSGKNANPDGGAERGAVKANPSSADASGEAGTFLPVGNRVVVIGSGPAGMAAAVGLARKGYQVEVFEQGSDVKKRFQDIRLFLKGNRFNPASNILFGEGGAGTFSDGKLTCRTRTAYTDAFLKELVASGADPEIAYLSHPHIGTDKLQFVIKGFRERCESAGCIFHFNTAVTDLHVEDGRITGVTVEGRFRPCDAVVLAAGHSSRMLYKLLQTRGVAMERKPFSVGVRVEHPQEMVNRRQLGEKVDCSITGAAEYYLTWNGDGEGQGMSAYSFCMCPGGVIVPCADAEDGLFTNGMSYSNRAGAFANSAVVVPLTPDTLSGEDVLAGLDFIRGLEVKAFEMGGGEFTFPAQSIRAYMEGRVDAGPAPKTSFTKPLRWADFRILFPPRIALALQESFRNFDRKLPGFISHGLIIGPESRTSSPVRVLRHSDTLESISTRGLFPLGEGAGYSGGIVSSGADGFRLAEAWRVWPAARSNTQVTSAE